MSNNNLLLSKEPNGLFRIQLNKPEVHNAFDNFLIQDLIEALKDAELDKNVRVILLESKGPSFSAGGDLNYMKRLGEMSPKENKEDAAALAELMKRLYFINKPTIARVQGPAFGGGVGLICCCDIAIGTPNSLFAFTEVKLGIVPATIGPYVVKTIGEKAAKRYFMTGEKIDANRALSLGILSEIVEQNDLDSSTNEIIKKLLKNGPNAVKTAKSLVVNTLQGSINQEMIVNTVNCIADARSSEEGKEGLKAFLEKRKPNWK